MTQQELEIKRRCYTIAASVFLSDRDGYNGLSLLDAFHEGGAEVFPEGVVVWEPIRLGMDHQDVANEIEALGDSIFSLVTNELMQAEMRTRDQVLAQMREAADAYRALGGAKEETGGDDV